VRAWLDQVQAHWDEQLRAFGAYVERAHAERGSVERDSAERVRDEGAMPGGARESRAVTEGRAGDD